MVSNPYFRVPFGRSVGRRFPPRMASRWSPFALALLPSAPFCRVLFPFITPISLALLLSRCTPCMTFALSRTWTPVPLPGLFRGGDCFNSACRGHRARREGLCEALGTSYVISADSMPQGFILSFHDALGVLRSGQVSGSAAFVRPSHLLFGRTFTQLAPVLSVVPSSQGQASLPLRLVRHPAPVEQQVVIRI